MADNNAEVVRPELVSRNGHPFASYAELAKQIAAHLPVNTVLDGEIVAVDRRESQVTVFHRCTEMRR